MLQCMTQSNLCVCVFCCTLRRSAFWLRSLKAQSNTHFRIKITTNAKANAGPHEFSNTHANSLLLFTSFHLNDDIRQFLPYLARLWRIYNIVGLVQPQIRYVGWFQCKWLFSAENSNFTLENVGKVNFFVFVFVWNEDFVECEHF